MKVAVACDEGLEAEARGLAERFELPVIDQIQVDKTPADKVQVDALLYLTGERLELRETGPHAPGPVYANFVSGRADYRRKHGGGKGQLLARAALPKGVVAPIVIDATAGLGRDAFVLAALGARVTLLERSPIVGALLEDALRRAHDSEVADVAARMILRVGDAISYLGSLSDHPEVIYLDPMYPHTKKSALQKKEMRLFQQLVGTDDDAAELLDAARRTACKRVVVKRPAGAPFLGDAQPQGRLESKNTRFDLYLSS